MNLYSATDESSGRKESQHTNGATATPLNSTIQQQSSLTEPVSEGGKVIAPTTAAWEFAKGDECGLPWNAFQNRTLPQLAKTSTQNDTFVWTISGGDLYRQHIPELLAHWQSLSVNVLVIALDEPTAQRVCDVGGGTAVFWDVPAQSYAQVADSKFQVSAALAAAGMHQLFVELDVFCRQSPVPLMRQPAFEVKNDDTNGRGVDIVTIGHGDLQQKINIGMYYVRASEQVADLFRTVTTALAPSLDSPTFHHSGRGKRHFFDQETFHDCLQYKSRRNAYYLHEDVNHTNNLLKRCNEFNLTSHMISNLLVSSYMPPVVFDSTICIHPLANTPFSSFKVKLATAKFLGFDPTPITSNERFLKTISGDIAYSEKWEYGFFAKDFHTSRLKSQKELQYNIALLVALAQHSNRTLVLPRHVRDKEGKAFPIYSLVSTTSMEQHYNITWRFLSKSEAQSLEHRTAVVELESFHNIAAAQQSVNNCTHQVCALHGLPMTSQPWFQKKELEKIIQTLKWCMPNAKSQPLLFTTGAGAFEHPCE